MDIAPVARAAVSDTVFAALVDEILSGRAAPGDALPSERELAAAFEVNRHAIREALKRVQQVGLVRIAQGGKTRIEDWRHTAGLEVLHALATSGAVPAERVLRDILALRATVAADAALLCATTATDAELARVLATADGYPAGPATVAELTAADLAFWTAVIDGTHNIAFRLGLNTLVAGIFAIGVERIPALVAEYADRDNHLALARLIADRDGDGAKALTERLLAPILEP
ncbi:FadR/GntR family transcriptional regulator [Lolliginicoccus suaedae]|uniref:FadR/GntR family transcriptional regulator n=1 Tax=Lolliginicoccus suaedae TaxID=2605429 RepID=UPI0011EC6E83|nr:GntR family transcriptional regulator [Lolliginicoccus suaedae]